MGQSEYMGVTRDKAGNNGSRSRTGCLWVLVVLQFLLLAVLMLAGLVFAAINAAVRRPARHLSMGADEYPYFREVWSCGAGDVKVVGISLQGMILLDEERSFFPSMPGSAQTALRSIRRATHDPDVRAIILSIDSGGGGITASDVIYKALLDFKAKGTRDRKVIAVLGDVAASGAYYVALGADHIVAHPTTITGSIGVLMQTLNVRELGQKIGVKDVTIKSGKDKDILNPLRELTEEQRAMLQSLVDELQDRFLSLVVEGRQLKGRAVSEIAGGQVFTASKALDLGLIDEVGYWDDAVSRTAELLVVDGVKVYRYESEFSLSALFGACRKWDPLEALLYRISRTRLLYLWHL